VANWAQIPAAARRNTAAGAGLDAALISTLHNGPARTATLPLSDPCGAVVAWASAPLLVMEVVRSVPRWSLRPCRSGLAFVLVDPASRRLGWTR
jgi:hypothetical protein